MVLPAFDVLMSALREDDLITIVLHDGETTYKVQRTLLVNTSPWFKKALSKQFKEGQERTLYFPGTREEVVEAFIYWLYHRCMPPSAPFMSQEEHPSDELSKNARARVMSELAVRLWIFGEEHLIPKLQNRAMRQLHQHCDTRYPTAELVKEVYEGSPLDSVLRKKLMVEVLLGWQGGYFNPKSEVFDDLGRSPGFLADFAKGTKELLDTGGKFDTGKFSVEAYLVKEE